MGLVGALRTQWRRLRAQGHVLACWRYVLLGACLIWLLWNRRLRMRDHAGLGPAATALRRVRMGWQAMWQQRVMGCSAVRGAESDHCSLSSRRCADTGKIWLRR